jgi:hypothetical protein
MAAGGKSSLMAAGGKSGSSGSGSGSGAKRVGGGKESNSGGAKSTASAKTGSTWNYLLTIYNDALTRMKTNSYVPVLDAATVECEKSLPWWSKNQKPQ